MQRLLSGKFANPMLGVYAAHILLLADEPIWDLIATVVDNLRELVGDHPDVRALGLAVERKATALERPRPFEIPPMLRASWNLIVQATRQDPALVVPGSLSARIATRLWGAGASLTWVRPPGEPVLREDGPVLRPRFAGGDRSDIRRMAVERPYAAAPDEMLGEAMAQPPPDYDVRSAAGPRRLGTGSQTPRGWTGVERAILERLVLAAGGEVGRRGEATGSSLPPNVLHRAIEGAKVSDLVDQLGIPAITVQQAMKGLRRKLF